MNHIPSLQANYTPVPNSFLQLAFTGRTSREELVVLLLFFSKTYGWKPEKGFISVEDLVHEAGLTAEEATRGLALAIDHDQVLEMPLDPKNPTGRSMYLLNTLENRRFLEAYASASFDAPPPPAPATPPAPARALPGPAAPGPRDPRARPEPSPLESGDLEAPPELPPIEDELEPVKPVPVAALEPLPASAPPRAPAAGPASAPPRAPGPVPTPSAGPAPALGKPLVDWGYQQRTIDMIIRLLGRVPSKDERARLAALGASDAELIDAMGRLLEKKVSVYSSDLIVYEYEAMKSAERRSQRTQVRKQEREDRIKRQKDCRRCDGLGYFFVGVSGIQECDCRK